MKNKIQLIKKIKSKKLMLGIVGLGYVGLPLAVEFSKIFNVVGYDNNERRNVKR